MLRAVAIFLTVVIALCSSDAFESVGSQYYKDSPEERKEGYPVKPGEIPWRVRLDFGGGVEPFSGAIIHREWILAPTSPKFNKSRDVKVYSGEVEGVGKHIGNANLIPGLGNEHPHILLLKMDQRIEFSQATGPIDLASTLDIPPYWWKTANASGWMSMKKQNKTVFKLVKYRVFALPSEKRCESKSFARNDELQGKAQSEWRKTEDTKFCASSWDWDMKTIRETVDFIDFYNAETNRNYMIGVRVGKFVKCGNSVNDCVQYSYLTSKSIGRIKRIIEEAEKQKNSGEK